MEKKELVDSSGQLGGHLERLRLSEVTNPNVYIEACGTS